MSAQRSYRDAEWDELDAIVGAELDLMLAHRPPPVAEPEVGEALFLDHATTFLTNHAEPARLIDELQRRVALVEAAEVAGFDEQTAPEGEAAPGQDSNIETNDTISSPVPPPDTEADPS